jgi:23S rRNA pseudouridine1911/1915/1917 synthase
MALLDFGFLGYRCFGFPVSLVVTRWWVMRLDKRVADEFGLSRRTALQAVRRGQIDVRGQTCLEPGRDIGSDASLAYYPDRPRPETAARRLTVLYEDRYVLIVDKPSGLLTQPTPDRERDTLLERAGRYLSRTRNWDSPFVGVVHRIDKGTSGVILLVCSPKALRPFQAMFRTHTIERMYLAVVEGSVQPPRGTFDWPLAVARSDGRRCVARRGDDGVTAITHYEQVEQFGGTAALIACRLETGRTHQIRIHLANAGHPIVGDVVYRSKSRPPFPVFFPRQALHARALGFRHPMTGEDLRIEAPLPSDLNELVAGLRNQTSTRA